MCMEAGLQFRGGDTSETLVSKASQTDLSRFETVYLHPPDPPDPPDPLRDTARPPTKVDHQGRPSRSPIKATNEQILSQLSRRHRRAEMFHLMNILRFQPLNNSAVVLEELCFIFSSELKIENQRSLFSLNRISFVLSIITSCLAAQV